MPSALAVAIEEVGPPFLPAEFSQSGPRRQGTLRSRLSARP
jgi:hypothetical protein